jgi:hypothetical protein
MSKQDGYGVHETFQLSGNQITTIVKDGCWKDNQFHGWGRLLEFGEVDELLGVASGVDMHLRSQLI